MRNYLRRMWFIGWKSELCVCQDFQNLDIITYFLKVSSYQLSQNFHNYLSCRDVLSLIETQVQEPSYTRRKLNFDAWEMYNSNKVFYNFKLFVFVYICFSLFQLLTDSRNPEQPVKPIGQNLKYIDLERKKTLGTNLPSDVLTSNYFIINSSHRCTGQDGDSFQILNFNFHATLCKASRDKRNAAGRERSLGKILRNEKTRLPSNTSDQVERKEAGWCTGRSTFHAGYLRVSRWPNSCRTSGFTASSNGVSWTIIEV